MALVEGEAGGRLLLATVRTAHGAAEALLLPPCAALPLRRQLCVPLRLLLRQRMEACEAYMDAQGNPRAFAEQLQRAYPRYTVSKFICKR